MPAKKKYESLRTRLSTGDIVLFSGKGGVSAGIKWATLSRWSHVGMVLVLPEYDFVCLWESTTLTSLKDLDTKRPNKGVQLVSLSMRVQEYEGDIALRKLQDVSLSAADHKALMKLRKALARRPYEKNKLELVRAAYDGPFGANREDLSSLFCSELVAEAYQTLGLVRAGKKGKPSNEYTPADFSADKENIPWIRGKLGQEIELRR